MYKKRSRIINIYIALWCLYYLVNIFLTPGGIISKVVFATLFALSIFYTFIVITKYYNSPYIRALNFLILSFSVYGFLLIIGSEVFVTRSGDVLKNTNYLKSIYTSLLPINVFFYFSQEGRLTNKSLKRWIILLVLVATAQYFDAERKALLEEAVFGNSSDEITNNGGYYILALLPLLVFYEKRIFTRTILLLYCYVLMFFSMKRGVILISMLCLPVILYQYYSGVSVRRKVAITLICFVLVLLVLYYLDSYINESDYFNRRVQSTLEGSSSGRDTIYTFLWNKFTNRFDFFNVFFGIGAYGTIKLYGQYAHNDWLEILINQGVLGVIIYLYYWVALVIEWKRIDKKSIHYLSVKLFVIIFFLQTLFSMSYNDIPFYASCALGYCLGRSRKPQGC